MLWCEGAESMSFHLGKSVNNVSCDTACVSKSNPLRPEVAGHVDSCYRYLGEDTLKELASAVSPPALYLLDKGNQLLMRALEEEAVPIPFPSSSNH